MSVSRPIREASGPEGAWVWPVDLGAYDARAGLSLPERKALGFAVRSMDRNANYVLEVQRPLGRLLLLREMHHRGASYWGWSNDQWLRTLEGSSAQTKGRRNDLSTCRRQLVAVAYLLCGFEDLGAVPLLSMGGLAARVFGQERLDEARDRVLEELVAWGWSREGLKDKLASLLARLTLANRSPNLEDLTTEKLQDAHERLVPPYLRSAVVAMSRALAAMGVVSAPVVPERAAGSRNAGGGFEDDCTEEWSRWCRRWHETSALTRRTCDGYLGALLQAGRWLARTHPEVTGPEQWTRPLAAEYVAAVDRLAVGEWSDAARVPFGKAGRPVSPSTKVRHIGAMRAFFKDCQEWGWVPRRFDPRHALATPRSVLAKLETRPRVIADDMWGKLLWAGLNLSAQDLPSPRWEHNGRSRKTPYAYPLEMVRAITVVWLFAGLRSDEIRRLRVGCVRWQRGEATVAGDGRARPKDAICWLDVPANKTSGTFTKPVDRAVGEAIESWEAVRPRQPSSVDPKTAEEVHFLFSYRGSQVGTNYLNDGLIPLLCRKAGVPRSDARGNITSHRARSTIASQLYNAKEPMSLFDLQEWLGHSSPETTQHYARITPTRLAKSYSDADYFGRNLRTIEVLLDREAVVSGAAAGGAPWKFYDLGHGYCSYDFYAQCPHRMACARCSFYVPKDSTEAQLLEGKANLSRMLEEMPLTDEEVAAVEEGIGLHQKLLERLADVPTPSGPTPRQLGFVPLSAKPP